MERWFPRGVDDYLWGGVMIGAGVALIFLGTGIRAGASGVFSAVLSWVSRHPALRTSELVAERQWRSVFTLGLIGGAALTTFVLTNQGAFVTSVQPWRLVLGGLAVGFGTRLARGCTSGHGICGNAAASRSSMAATLTFMGVAIGVAHLVEWMGVRP